MGETTTIKTQDGDFAAYVARPSNPKAPAVVVIQEIFGVNAVMRGVCDELAAAGFLAVCPDLFWRIEPGVDITDQSEAEWKRAFELFNAFDVDAGVKDIQATIKTIRADAGCSGKVGAVGFCWGGAMVNNLATVSAELAAGVAYYGRQPPLEAVPNIKAPLLLHYAGLDTAINAGIAGYEQALSAAGKAYTLHMYEGVNHAFSNDTSPTRFDAAAAALAWSRTIAFLKQHLA